MAYEYTEIDAQIEKKENEEYEIDYFSQSESLLTQFLFGLSFPAELYLRDMDMLGHLQSQKVWYDKNLGEFVVSPKTRCSLGELIEDRFDEESKP